MFAEKRSEMFLFGMIRSNMKTRVLSFQSRNAGYLMMTILKTFENAL